MIIAVTIDMCQSHKPYEKKLFQALEVFGRQSSEPVPIAVAVAGGWLRQHRAELKEIKQMNLNITWVNHSYSHPVDNGFLNNPKVDFKHEVLANVELMKKFGLTPSKYFRFPGLVHNEKRLKELKALGYINLDANAWLGKGQRIKDGAIILIHGNGNEEPGVVDKFISWLKHNKNYRLVPLDDIMTRAEVSATS